MQPYLYLYRTKDGVEWRAKLSIIDFIETSGLIFTYFMQ
jgi:hypothetical protein